MLLAELNLTREEEPVVLRNLLSSVARHVDVRLLVWEGAPLPVFRPTRRDVQSYMKIFTRGTNIQAETDSCVRLKYSHHEKVVVVDDEVAFVGGIDLTLDGGDPFDTPKHPSRGQIGWHDAAVRIEGPAVADVANHFRLRWRGPGEERLPEPTPPAPNGDVELQVVRTLPEDVFVTMPSGEFSVFESYTRALRSAGALRLPREPVPLVARDRRDPRRQAPQSALRRLPHGRGRPRTRTTGRTSRGRSPR